MIICAFIVCVAIVLGVVIAVQEHRGTPGTAGGVEDRSGWIYFACGEDTLVKVGMTSREPTVGRLPELSTMSPVPLRIVYKAFVDDRRKVERALHAELGPYRQHGEWFDRDAALAYADHLRGEW